MNELHLFAGAGGGILGGMLLGHTCVCAVEIEPYPRKVLLQRQRDGILPKFPIWDDVTTFDGRPWKGLVDIVCGGFPCQDISAAGKGAGLNGERSGLWSEMSRIIGEVGPQYVLVENSPILTSRGLGTVLGDLATMGYDARWGVLGAVDAGAPHKRDRIWVFAADAKMSRLKENEHIGNEPEITVSSRNGDVADAEIARFKTRDLHKLRTEPGSGEGLASCCGGKNENLANASSQHGERKPKAANIWNQGNPNNFGNRGWWESEPNVGRVAHGVAARVDRLKAIGNGQVPAVAALAFRLLSTNQETK